MAEISKIKLPSGNVYDIKDAVARAAIAGGVSFIIAWNGSSTPVVANIPAGVTVVYNNTNYTGTLSPTNAQAGAFYLVKSSTQAGTLDIYDEYSVIKPSSTSSSWFWEKIGDTQVDISSLGELAYKDNVTLNKGAGDVVLGESTTFTNGTSAVTFAAHTKDNVLGSDATFTTTVTPTTTNIKATASGAAVGADGTAAAITGFGAHTTDTFVKSVSAETNKKLVTTTIPNVTGNTSVTANKSTWNFTMGSDTDAETLIIGGGNGSDVTATNTTLGTAITAATGATDANGTGDSIVTGVTIGQSASAITALGTPTTSNCLTGVKVTTQPTVTLATGATAGTGVISVATGITSATTVTNNKDEVSAITALGAGTAAAQTITVGTNDKVTVAKHDDLSVTVS